MPATASVLNLLEDLIQDTSTEEVANLISEVTNQSIEQVKISLDTYLNEARLGIRVVEPYLHNTSRILEVGGGIGAVSTAIHRSGLEIYDLEPIGPAFDFIRHARRAVRKSNAASELPMTVSDLNSADHGTFDLIYSINVLEHVPDPMTALDRMLDVCAPGGTIVIMCPNYAFPFEPHVSRPLIPRRPDLTRHVFRKAAKREVWDTLNWVTASQISHWATANKCDLRFKTDMVSSMIQRMSTDSTFRNRHKFLARIADTLTRLKVASVMDKIPATWLSPMQFEIRKQLEPSRS